MSTQNTTTQHAAFAESTIVAFHIGRGGRFYNAGHKTFVDSGRGIGEFLGEEEFLAFENQVAVDEAIDCRENLRTLFNEAIDHMEEAPCNNPAYLRLKSLGLDLGELIYTDYNGNHVELTYDEAISGIGTINHDEDYDTTYTCYLSDCSEEELQIIADAIERGDYVDSDVIAYVHDKLGIEEKTEDEE